MKGWGLYVGVALDQHLATRIWSMDKPTPSYWPDARV